jgi:hypothetical protein
MGTTINQIHNRSISSSAGSIITSSTASSQIDVAVATANDLPHCVAICNNAWKGIYGTTLNELTRRTIAFKEGGIVVGKVDGKVEGYISFQQLQSPVIEGTWNSVTDHGCITNSHKPNGGWVMGLGLAVSKKGTKAGLSHQLIRYVVEYVVKNRKKGVLLVIRMSGYNQYKDQYSPEKYAALKRKDGHPVDQSLRFFSHQGFKVSKQPKLLENYVDGGGDPNSCGYSLYITKKNPVAWVPKPVAVLLSKLLFLVWRAKG